MNLNCTIPNGVNDDVKVSQSFLERGCDVLIVNNVNGSAIILATCYRQKRFVIFILSTLRCFRIVVICIRVPNGQHYFLLE